jgi:hypothetical protein
MLLCGSKCGFHVRSPEKDGQKCDSSARSVDTEKGIMREGLMKTEKSRNNNTDIIKKTTKYVVRTFKEAFEDKILKLLYQ